MPRPFEPGSAGQPGPKQDFDLLESIQRRIDDFLDSQIDILAPLGEYPLTLLDFSRDFLKGGKRFRGQFCYWGWKSVRGEDIPHEALEGIVTTAAALEIFHAAALVHDDLIDNSDTRRGMASTHRHFEGIHKARSWRSEADAFGVAAAVLLGDLLIVWSDELLAESARSLPPSLAAAVRREFNTMRTQVTAGQYLDVLEEHLPIDSPELAVERAERVITYKSAKYSIEAPLAIGALFAGASETQLEALRSYGLPLGLAFQLRDDVLGVFGDSSVTGKPSGDDLREGKRTVLIALTRQFLEPDKREQLDAMLGDPDLDAAAIEHLQDAIASSGALAAVEGLIAQRESEALVALDDASLNSTARESLARLADIVTARVA